MADVKISALPAATTPLGGTEVLPIVQSSTTKKVSIADVTAGRAVSASSLTLTTPLDVASGGTGLTSLTAGRIPYGAGTGAFGNSANLFFNGTNLGIGTSSPTSYGAGYTTLAVNGSSAGSVIDTSVAGVRIGTFFALSDNSVTVGNVTNNPLAFRTNNIERMRLDASGNLGIGTSSPGSRLDVRGTVNFSAIGAQNDFNLYGPQINTVEANWNFAGLNVIRRLSNTTTPRLFAMPLGGDSLSSTSIGDYNAIWGVYNASPTSTSTSSALQGEMAYAAFYGHRWYINGTERARIDSSGNLLVGTTSNANNAKVVFKQSVDNDFARAFSIEMNGSTNKWQQMVDGSTSRFYLAYNSTGKGYFDSSTGAYTAISDRRAKKNIAPCQYGLSHVLQMQPVEYNMLQENDGSKKHLGFIAQDLKVVIDEAVDDLSSEDSFYGLDKSGLVPVLVNAIQELAAEVASLKEQLNA